MLEFGKIHVVHGFFIAVVELVTFVLVLDDVLAGGTELGFVELVAKAFACLVNFLLNLVVKFGYLIFDEHVGTVAFLGVLVVNQRVVESVHVTAGFPNGRVHEDGGIDADDVLVETGHGIPPVFLDVVFEFRSVLSVVVNRSETVIDFGRREYESIFFAVRYEFLEGFFLSCHDCYDVVFVFCFLVKEDYQTAKIVKKW